MAAKIFRINYKSDFILTMNSEAGWTIPFCIKFWTSIPMRAYYVGFDGTTYTHCAYNPAEPTKLLVQFDDHHLPIGNLHFQIAYHFTVEDFPNNTEDEVFNATAITTEIDGETYQVMLDFTGETAPGIDFNMPSVGVTSVNGKIGAVTLNAEDVGAQPTIEDLATIRSGAAEGASAVQPDEMTAALATKQDTISDLATIRSGAAAGATAVQPAALTPIQTALQTIEAVIPSAASSQNQLADKNFVNSSIATNTANFVGTYNSLAELQAVQNPTNNDYGFVIETDAQGNEYYDRYKYVAASQQWLFEYKVESTPFTASQWAAIQSGITSALVTKLNALPTAQQLTNQLAAKQDTISDLATIRSNAANAETNTGNKAYNVADFSGLGRVNLQKNIVEVSGTNKNVLTQAMVNTANTIYVIQYDYDLNGQTITIPAGCVLEFNGGSLGNGTLKFQDTKITGNANITTDIDSTSTIFGTVDISWFGLRFDDYSFDNGTIINNVAAVFKYISIPNGILYFTTPIEINEVKNVDFKCILKYRGGDNNPALKFYNTSTANVKINYVEASANAFNFTAISDNPAIGVLIENCSRSSFRINMVMFFNEGIRISGHGAPCCYNQITFDNILDCSIGIRIYQENVNTTIGYSNQNIFFGGSFFQSSTWVKSLRRAIYIKGSTEGTDTYNTVNNLCFVGISTEGPYTPFYLYNAQYITFISCRTENATYFAESNKASDHVIIGGYGTKKINYTGSDRVSDHSWNYSTLVDVNLSNFHPVSNGVLCDVGGNSGNSSNVVTPPFYSGKIVNGLLTRTNNNYGIKVDTSTFKLLNVEMDTAGRFMVAYFDSEGNNITSNYSSVTPSVGMSFSSNRFVSGGNVKSASIAIPVGVSICTISTNANFSRFVIKGRYPEMGVLKMSNHTPSQGATSERPTYYPLSDLFYDTTLGKFIANNGSWVDVDGNPADALHSGTTSSRPTGVKVGFQYFDTTLGKPIYWTGSAWVDATGTVV